MIISILYYYSYKSPYLPERKKAYKAIEKALQRTTEVNNIINERKRGAEKVGEVVGGVEKVGEVVGRDCAEEMNGWLGENVSFLCEGSIFFFELFLNFNLMINLL